MIIHHLILICIIFFHLAPQLTIWSNRYHHHNHLHKIHNKNESNSYILNHLIYYYSNLNCFQSHLLDKNFVKSTNLISKIGAYASDRGHRTLRMFQTHACEGDNLNLICPKNSAISIYSAHFSGLRGSTESDKNRIAELCPNHLNKINLLDDRKREDQKINSTLKCSSVQAFRIVDTKCRDNQTCTIQSSIAEFLAQPNLTLINEQEEKKFKQSTEIMIDLCSNDLTYSEVMYRCKPTSISSKAICENEILHLNCPRKQVIHIYKAFYGEIQELYTAQCKSLFNNRLESKSIKSNSINNDDEDECQITNETEMLIEYCQGFRKCNLNASDETFYKNQTDAIYQMNCNKRKRLKVHYTCTNSKILTDDYQKRSNQPDQSHEQQTQQQSSSQSTTSTSTTTTLSFDENFLPSDDSSSSSEQQQINTEQQTSTQSVPNHFEILNPSPSKDLDELNNDDDDNHDANCTTILAKKTALGFISEWIQAVYYVGRNLERLLLYFLVSILFALLCIVIVMSCKLFKDKNRAKKCIKQQQLPNIFEYQIDEDDEENLMSPLNNASDHFKQLQRHQLTALLNQQQQQQETNNNNLHQSSRNTVGQQSTTFYSQQSRSLNNNGNHHQLIRNSPTSQINPNYIHPFLNEQELIQIERNLSPNENDNDDDEDDGGFISPEFTELNTERQQLMVYSNNNNNNNTIPIRSSFKTSQNLTTNPNPNPNQKRPIIIKDHASTIHFIRSSSTKPKTIVVQTNRTVSSSSVLSALLTHDRRLNNYQFNKNSSSFFNNNKNNINVITNKNDEQQQQQEQRPILGSSSPNLQMHALISITPTSSQNTILTSANTTSFQSNSASSSCSPQSSFSQRCTPQSKNRLKNFDAKSPTTANEMTINDDDDNANSQKSQSTKPIIDHSFKLLLSNSIQNSSFSSQTSDSSPVQSPKSLLIINSTSPKSFSSSTKSTVSLTNSSSTTNISPKSSPPLDNNNYSILNEDDLKIPIWLNDTLPIKQSQNTITNETLKKDDKKSNQTISSVGELIEEKNLLN